LLSAQNPRLDSENSVFQRGAENLAQILFSGKDVDADLKLIIEQWDGLSVELRKAIVRMVE
jgi:hypothetical protein